jgi:hypothetical protein
MFCDELKWLRLEYGMIDDDWLLPLTVGTRVED